MSYVSKFVSVYPLLGALAVGACASEPNKDVQDAHQAQAKDNNEYWNEQAKLNQKQAEDRVALQREQTNEQADLHKERHDDAAATSKNASQAQAEMTQERREFAADVEKRIQKADAKANELLTKSNRLSPAKKAKFDAAWNEYKGSRESAADKAKTIYTVADPEWTNSKSDIETSIKRLEDSVDKIDKVF